jgi:ppGpp synthetase/RelA/SpoT-type nucleotidyltranferase
MLYCMDGLGVHAEIEAVISAHFPEMLRSPEEFEAWYFPMLFGVQVAAVEVYEHVAQWLEAEGKCICAQEHARDVWSLFPNDAQGLTKSPQSLRTKLGRDLVHNPPNHRLEVAEVESRIFQVPDLARFRIVCNFASDADYLLSHLLVEDGKGRKLGNYLVHGALKDYVYDLDLRNPARGHRARQFAVEVPAQNSGRPILVEIQVMTLLQHAWDRRNHPFYEWTRCGAKLPPDLIINDVALAETLHLVDRQAADNWQRFLEIVRRAS